MCEKWTPLGSLHPESYRIVARTYMCWTPAQARVGDEFAGATYLPAGYQVVPATIIHALFQSYYFQMWLPYFLAWKGNWGYGAVPDDGTAGFNTKYQANLQWCYDWKIYGSAYAQMTTKPGGCNCCVNGCFGS